MLLFKIIGPVLLNYEFESFWKMYLSAAVEMAAIGEAGLLLETLPECPTKLMALAYFGEFSDTYTP